MITDSIFDINERPQYDDTISEIKYMEYNPIVGTNLNTDNSEINVIIENQDVFLLPYKSFLYIEGQLLRAKDNAVFTDADNLAFVNNGPMFLFKNIKYELSGKTIEQVNVPGTASLLKGLLTYGVLFGNYRGLNMGFSFETFANMQDFYIKKPNPKGSFSFLIPLHYIFGFCEDYQKVIYGIKHQLVMLRNSDNNALLKNGVGVESGKVNLTKLSWIIPHIMPNDMSKIKLYKQIEQKVKIPIAFRQRQLDKIQLTQTNSFSWRLLTTTVKPRWIIVAFQTDRDNNQLKDNSQFDHCKLTNIKAILNSETYPSGSDVTVNFESNQYAKAYNMIDNFILQYYNEIERSCINPEEFKSKYPLFVIDCTRQSERLKMNVIDIKLEMQFKENVADKTMCYALILSDRELALLSDGLKMELIY